MFHQMILTLKISRIVFNPSFRLCRFVATSGFTSDVKVWEVKFSRTGEFEKVHRAFELPGSVRHSC
jgi:hypothetical protein